MKNILFVSGSLGGGGAERVASILASYLCDNGNNIYFLAFRRNRNNYTISNNIHVIYPDINGAKIRDKIKKILTIRDCILKYQIDDVIAFSYYNNMYAVVANMGLKTKIIGSERCDPAQLQSKKIINKLRNLLYQKIDVLVCQTDSAKKYFSKKIQSKTVVILNPLSKNLIDAYHGERENKIVTFCRLHKQKNLAMLIRVFYKLHKEYPNYKLEIYGEGPEHIQLQSLIDGLFAGNYITIYPFLKDIHERIKRYTLFALTSNYEGLSNSMLESMAIGLPVVVTDSAGGGASMVIRNRVNGMISPIKDEEAFYNNMKEVISNKQLADRISYNGAKIRDELCEEKIAAQWIELL